jgi:hypothetical protein
MRAAVERHEFGARKPEVERRDPEWQLDAAAGEADTTSHRLKSLGNVRNRSIDDMIGPCVDVREGPGTGH